jgi:hypothetical protein
MTPEQEQAIADLRLRNVPPKLIARQLGLRPADVSAVIKTHATQAAISREAAGELPPVHQCLVNANCLTALFENHANSGKQKKADAIATDNAGARLAVVLVSRNTGFNRIQACTYLVDYFCLGVKNVTGPRNLNPTDYQDFVADAFRAFPIEPEEISLEIAQAIVLGALEYAAQLGLEPHRDFAAARPLLGEWKGEPKLTFGHKGKPLYVNGPYDDPMKIVRTLRQSVGDGNFDYLLGPGDF